MTENTGNSADYLVDVTGDVCPLTFARTRLALEGGAPGEVVEVRVAGGEPLENIPVAARALGHEVLGIEAETAQPGIHRIRIRIGRPQGGNP